MNEMKNIETNNISTEAGSWDQVAQSLELYGGKELRRIDGDPDDLPIPPQGDVEICIARILDHLEDLAAGTRLADELGDLVSTFCTGIHYRLQRVTREHEQDCDEIRRLAHAVDGSEIGDLELQRATKRGHASGHRLEMLETLRDVLVANADGRYDARWTPPKGSYTSRARKLTHAVIEARDFLAASLEAKREAMMPEGTRIGFSGGVAFQDASCIWNYLDRQRTRCPDMVLVTTGINRGGDHIAGLWARERAVPVIRCTLDRKHGNRAAFVRNEEMMKLGLHALIATPGNGITENLVGLARERYRIPVRRIGMPPRDTQPDQAKPDQHTS